MYGLSPLHLAFLCTDLGLSEQDPGLVEVSIQESLTVRKKPSAGLLKQEQEMPTLHAGTAQASGVAGRTGVEWYAHSLPLALAPALTQVASYLTAMKPLRLKCHGPERHQFR